MSKFEINNLTKNRVDRKFLQGIAKKALKFVKVKIPEISIVLVGEAKIKELNKKYRKKDKVTDVLAFDYGPPGGQREIFICLPQAKKQAKQAKHSLNKELAILLIHGILHLSEYKEHNKILKKQEEIWLKIM